MTNRERQVEDLMDWILANPCTASVADCEDKIGAEFIARCIVRATPDSAKVTYLLTEFMQEKGMADREEAENLFLEMFRQANRLMCAYSDKGVYFNFFDWLDAEKGRENKIISFGSCYHKMLKLHGKAGAE